MNTNVCCSIAALLCAAGAAALAWGQALPCVVEYTGSSCTLFLKGPHEAECPSVIHSQGWCPQTMQSGSGLTTQDASFAGPTCNITQYKPNPQNPEECVVASSYNGPGRCRTASGTACPGQPGQ